MIWGYVTVIYFGKKFKPSRSYDGHSMSRTSYDRAWYMGLYDRHMKVYAVNAAHLLRPKGTLGQEQDNPSFKSYKAARCSWAPSCLGRRAARAARAANLCLKVVLYCPQSWGCFCSRQVPWWIFCCRWCALRLLMLTSQWNRIHYVPVVLRLCSKDEQLKKRMKLKIKTVRLSLRNPLWWGSYHISSSDSWSNR